jgi:FkbM family methyltransferase
MSILRKFINVLFKNIIITKRIVNSNKYLAYNLSQHLTFLFKRRIDYEPEVWNNIKPYLKENSLIYDIGSNIGQYGIRFSELASNGKVICVEPDPGNLLFLYFNRGINNTHNIQILNVGIGAVNGKIKFYRDITNGGRLSSFNKDRSLISSEVESITFDNLISQCGVPDFVKIDVEGFENQVLNSLTNCDDKTIYLVEVRESTKSFVFDYFHHKDYLCYCVDVVEKYMIDNSSSIPGFANLLFIKNGN